MSTLWYGAARNPEGGGCRPRPIDVSGRADSMTDIGYPGDSVRRLRYAGGHRSVDRGGFRPSARN